MALILSAATGNFNETATWVGGVVPTVGDEARASTGHTITITANVTCDEVSNAGTGIYTLNSGVTLTANVTNKSTTVTRNCLQFTAVSPAVGSIVGNCTGGTAVSAIAANNTSSGTLTITGNVTSGSASSSNGATNSGSGTITITGNVTAGSGANGVHNGSTGTVTITGNVTASSTASVHGANNNLTGTLNIIGNATGAGGSAGHGANNSSTGTLNITGNATGGSVSGSSGANNAAAGVITIIGKATGGVSGPGALNASTGSITATRAVGNGYGPGSTGLAAAVGVANSALGVVSVEELEYGTLGMSPTSGTGIRLKKANTNVAVFNFCDTASAKTLIDATANAAMPAANHVRSGLSYAGGAATGTLAVPLPSQVAVGVATDNTVGTAFVTGSDIAIAVWGAATRTITGGMVDTATTLTNSPDVPTEAEIASAVWGAATKEITGGTVTTLTNAPTVPTVVQIRQEMDSNSTKLANLDTTVSSRLAPSGTLATVTTLTNAPTVPSATDIATQVRTELATELARVDAAVSTRLAGSAYTAPANSDVAAIKVKTDALNTERLANVATTAIVGNLIAQANS